MRINLSEVEERDFTALPSGKYVVKFTGYEMKATKGGEGAKLPGDTPMINWEMTVERHIDGTETYKNRKLWMNTIIHEKTLFNLKGLLKACGYTDEQVNDPDGIDFDPDAIIDHVVVAVVAVRQYQGDDTNDVKRLMQLDAAQLQEAGSLLP